jgi:hypothetical protein
MGASCSACRFSQISPVASSCQSSRLSSPILRIHAPIWICQLCFVGRSTKKYVDCLPLSCGPHIQVLKLMVLSPGEITLEQGQCSQIIVFILQGIVDAVVSKDPTLFLNTVLQHRMGKLLHSKLCGIPRAASSLGGVKIQESAFHCAWPCPAVRIRSNTASSCFHHDLSASGTSANTKQIAMASSICSLCQLQLTLAVKE